MTIHPKTSGAAVGAALGTLLVSILGSIHGVHLTSAADASIPGFLSILGAWLVPAPTQTTLPVQVVVAKPPETSQEAPPTPLATPAVPSTTTNP